MDLRCDKKIRKIGDYINVEMKYSSPRLRTFIQARWHLPRDDSIAALILPSGIHLSRLGFLSLYYRDRMKATASSTK